MSMYRTLESEEDRKCTVDEFFTELLMCAVGQGWDCEFTVTPAGGKTH